MAHKYGAPPLTGEYAATEQELVLAVLDETYQYFSRIWRVLLSQKKGATATIFKAKLADHSGVNKDSRPSSTPSTIPYSQAGRVIADHSEVVCQVQRAWKEQYFWKVPNTTVPGVAF